MNPSDILLPIGEVSELLEVSIPTLRCWDETGKLLAIRTSGGHRRYTLKQLDLDDSVVEMIISEREQAILDRQTYQSDLCKHIYESRKSQGLCVQCGRPNDGSFVNCSSCRKDKAEQKRKYKKTKKGHGKIAEYAAQRRKDPKYKEWRRNYMRDRYASDIQFKIAKLLRDRLAQAIKGNYKGGSAVESLGCSIVEFKAYLETMFELEMTWENHGHGDGKWNIDHIRPLASFDLTDPKQVSAACHYTNLQPLWYRENVSKGSKQEPSIESHGRF